jgi:hypothetical protein
MNSTGSQIPQHSVIIFSSDSFKMPVVLKTKGKIGRRSHQLGRQGPGTGLATKPPAIHAGPACISSFLGLSRSDRGFKALITLITTFL